MMKYRPKLSLRILHLILICFFTLSISQVSAGEESPRIIVLPVISGETLFDNEMAAMPHYKIILQEIYSQFERYHFDVISPLESHKALSELITFSEDMNKQIYEKSAITVCKKYKTDLVMFVNMKIKVSSMGKDMPAKVKGSGESQVFDAQGIDLGLALTKRWMSAAPSPEDGIMTVEKEVSFLLGETTAKALFQTLSQ